MLDEPGFSRASPLTPTTTTRPVVQRGNYGVGVGRVVGRIGLVCTTSWHLADEVFCLAYRVGPMVYVEIC